MGIAIIGLILPLSNAFATATGDAVKWSQLPEMTRPWGEDISSNYDPSDGRPKRVVMDDWTCLDGRPVTDIHWWGSYFINVNQGDQGNQGNGSDGEMGTQCEHPHQPTPPIESFRILIHKDVPKTCWVPSHPGDFITSYDIPFEETNEVYIKTDAQGHKVFQYNFDLPAPFEQEQGKIYWLGIVAILSKDFHSGQQVWGWHTSELGPPPDFEHNIDDSVSIYDYSFRTGNYHQWLPNKYTLTDRQEEWDEEGCNPHDFFDYNGHCKPRHWDVLSLNMAFELTTASTPEPGTIIMLAAGAAALAATATRARFGKRAGTRTR